MRIACGFPQIVIECPGQVQGGTLKQAVLGINSDFRHCQPELSGAGYSSDRLFRRVKIKNV